MTRPPPDSRSRSPRPGQGLVELRIRGGPLPHWMQELRARWGAGVRLHVCRPTDGSPRRLLQLLEINSTPAAVPEIKEFLQQRPRPEEVSLTELASHRLLVRLAGPLPPVCRSVFRMGAICMSCPFLSAREAPGGDPSEGEWRVLVHQVRDAHPLLASLSSPGHGPASLVRLGTYRGPRDLTPRQELAVGTAFALGYYDFPRRAQLKDVAKSLGVSRATAMENLRRGIRKLAYQRQAEVGGLRPHAARGDPPSHAARAPLSRGRASPG